VASRRSGYLFPQKKNRKVSSKQCNQPSLCGIGSIIALHLQASTTRFAGRTSQVTKQSTTTPQATRLLESSSHPKMARSRPHWPLAVSTFCTSAGQDSSNELMLRDQVVAYKMMCIDENHWVKPMKTTRRSWTGIVEFLKHHLTSQSTVDINDGLSHM